jgi:peptidyl-prolyl cis-trans isomerase SurA
MRTSTILLLGAAMLMAAPPLSAQTTATPKAGRQAAPRAGLRADGTRTPAVPVRTATQTTAPLAAAPQTTAPQTTAPQATAPQAAAVPPGAQVPPTLPAAATDAADAPPTAAPETASTGSAPTAGKPVQEADVQDNSLFAPLQTTTPVDPRYTDGIAATVNDEPISEYEIRQRMALYLATSGLHNLTKEQEKRVRGQILDQLEDEKLQLQEAQRKKITVSPVEVDKRINLMMTENHFDIAQLRKTLAAAGASEDALRAQITASIAWQKAVQDEYQDRVNVTPQMIDAEMRRNAESADKPHFRVSEIFLPVDNPEQDEKVKKDALDIEEQLQQGAPFQLVARQFSQHPTAASGGDIGWVYLGQLAPELNQALAKMETGDISAPIRSTGGWYILALHQRQEPLGTKVAKEDDTPVGPDSVLPLARLLLPMPPDTPKDGMDKVMTVASQISARIGNCGQLDKIHQQLPGSVYMNLGNMKLSELSPQMRDALTKTKAGEVAPPFSDEAGVEIIVRCDKREPVRTAYTLPTREAIENQLFEQQISAMARRYIRDLKRSANIQLRDSVKAEISVSDAKVR